MAMSPSEIREIAARSQNHGASEYAVKQLRTDLEKAGIGAKPFLDFIPIRLVTIIEHEVRGVIKEAVDHGEPYRTRGIAIIGKWSGKTVAEALLAVAQKEITIGQLVAHGFSVGRLSDIAAILEVVLGVNVATEFSTIRTRWVEEEKNEPDPIISDKEATFRIIEKLFQVRHILVHERPWPTELPYKRETVDEFLDHAELFVKAMEWIKVSKLYSRVPYTQSEMNIQAGRSAREKQDKLDALRGGDRAKFQYPKSYIEEIEYHWDKFCDLFANRYAGYFDEGPPGTIAPFLYASAMEAMTEWRIQNILDFSSPWNPAELPSKR